MSVTDADARAAEEMADSLLRDSPTPEMEEEERRHEEILIGKPMMLFPLNLDFPLTRLFCSKFLLRSSKSRRS